MEEELEAYIQDVLKVCSSRATFIINHIVSYGSIDSEQIQRAGYVHGARAVGDVRDNGVPLITGKVKSSDGRSIALYTFGNAADIKKHKFGGRINFPAWLKPALIQRDGLTCAISGQSLPSEDLQIDHRVPYYIAGDIAGSRNPDDFMLLSKSMQRAKSWDCENCDNLKLHFDPDICRSCYWACPYNYTHVAMKKQRSITVTWQAEEVAEFDMLKKESSESDCSPHEIIRLLVKNRYKH